MRSKRRGLVLETPTVQVPPVLVRIPVRPLRPAQTMALNEALGQFFGWTHGLAAADMLVFAMGGMTRLIEEPGASL